MVRRLVLRGSAIALVAQASGALATYILQVVVARWAGASGFGTYSLIVASATLLSTLASCGLPAAVVRFIPEYGSAEDWSAVRGLMRWSRAGTLCVAIVIASVGTGAVAIFGVPGQVSRDAVIASCWLVVPMAIMNLQQELARAEHRIASAYLPSMLARPVLAIGLLAAAYASGSSISGVEAGWITVAAVAAVAIAQAALIARATGLPERRRPPRYEFRTWTRVALPLLLVSGFVLTLNQVDILLVGLLRGSHSAGIYTAATKTAALVTYVLFAVNASAAPMFAELWSAGDVAALQRLVSFVAHWIFWPALALSVVLSLGAPVILQTFGSGFHAAELPLTILLCGQLVNAGAGSVGYLLTATGHQDECAWVYGSCAAANVVLQLILINLFGLVGAAIATTASMVIWNVWLHHLVSERVGVHASVLSALTIARQTPERGLA